MKCEIWVKNDKLVYAKTIIDSVIRNIPYYSEYKEEPRMNEHKTIDTTILVKGPRYNNKLSTLQQIIFEFSTNSTLLMKSLHTSRTPVYADARGYVALVMDKEEILAEKFRALLSPKRKHRERDLYDIFFFLKKQTTIRKDLIMKKLNEVHQDSNINDILDSITSIKGAWKNLEPFVQHTLENYETVKEFVLEKFNEANKKFHIL